jgi:hypothetical protein
MFFFLIFPFILLNLFLQQINNNLVFMPTPTPTPTPTPMPTPTPTPTPTPSPMPTLVSIDDTNTCFFVVDPNPNQISPDIWVNFDATAPDSSDNSVHNHRITASSEELTNNLSVCVSNSQPQQQYSLLLPPQNTPPPSSSLLSCRLALSNRRNNSRSRTKPQQDAHHHVKDILQSNPTYFHPHLIVRSSVLGGCGVFAAQGIPSKTFLCQYYGTICQRKDSESLLKRREEDCGESLFAFDFTWNGRRFSVVPSGDHLSIYFNHALKKSPTNNIIKKLIAIDGDQQCICFFTKRHILADEELLFDYEVTDPDILARPENAFLRRRQKILKK